MKVKAYAKVNLALDVVDEREDGYHELRMVMAPITLHDLLIIHPIKEKEIRLSSNSKVVPLDERNIVYKVAKRLIDDYHIEQGVKIHIYKHIPSQAGLAGGSADGAAVLCALNKLFHLNLSKETLAQIGATIGADIPFCIYNQTAEVQGIGEKLNFIDNHFSPHMLLVKPYKGVSTKKSFDSLDMNSAIHPNIDEMIEGIQENDYFKVVNSLGNSLEAPSEQIVKEIKKIKEEMLGLGFDGALMSGSGSCVFGLTQDESVLQRGLDYFNGQYFFVRATHILHDYED